MWPNRVSNSGPLALKSDALPTMLRAARPPRAATGYSFHKHFMIFLFFGKLRGSFQRDFERFAKILVINLTQIYQERENLSCKT